MPAKPAWINRRFSFDFPVEWYPDFIERLRGTPARAEDHVRRIRAAIDAGRAPADALIRQQTPDSWSMLENIGHLTVVEALWEKRLDEYLAGSEALSAADMSNKRTFEAQFNRRPADDVLREFRSTRHAFVARLDALSDADFARTALHPRLQKPMRLVDGLYFSACHDDYHLARASELARWVMRQS